MNKWGGTGYLAADPTHQYTKSGKPVCTFRVGVTRRFTNAQGVRESDFFPVVAWGKQADLAARYLSKGSRVGIVGTLQTRSYEAQDGTKRYVTEIVAEEIEFLSSSPKEQSGDDAVSQAQAAFGAEFVQVTDDDLPF